MSDRRRSAPLSGVDPPGSPQAGRCHPDIRTGRVHDPSEVAPWRSLLRRIRSLRRPRVASRASLLWLALFPLFLGLAGFVVVRLWEAGTKAALHSTEGQTIEIITDPLEAGFEAVLDPTPTLLIAHTDNGGLAGVTVVARASTDAGGHLVLIDPLLFVRSAPGSDEGRFVSEVFQAEGVDGLEALIGGVFGFGFGHAIELSGDDLGAAMSLAEPIPLELFDDLVTGEGTGEEVVWIESGSSALDGSTAAAVYNFVHPSDVGVNRQERQRVLWQSWLSKIGSAEDRSAAAEVVDPVLSSYLLSLAAGEVAVEILPTRLVVFDDSKPFYVLEDEDLVWIDAKADAMVPVPMPPLGESWPNIRLLDGVGDQSAFSAARDMMFDLKLQVTVVGNAAEFGVERSSIAYYATADETAATAVAQALGIGSELSEEPGRPGQLTVTIGEDWPVS